MLRRSLLFLALTLAALACTTTAAEPTQKNNKTNESSSGSEDPADTSSSSSSSSSSGSSGSSGASSGSSGTTGPKAGTFAAKWNDGTQCSAEPDIQVHAYNDTTTIFRQSLCTHYEGPFMFLFVGTTKALLIDTGTGDVNVRTAVDTALAGKDVDLIVSHSHAHSDHVGGDSDFANRARTTVVQHSATAVAQFFKLAGANKSAEIDLGGGRIIDVMAIPGHEAAHIAFYDRETQLLHTGDTLYPGRLYIQDFTSYKASIAKLVAFVDASHPVSFVVGNHIELSATQVELKAGAPTHPNEHVLQLGDAELRDLLATVNAMGNSPVRKVRPNFIVVPN